MIFSQSGINAVVVAVSGLLAVSGDGADVMFEVIEPVLPDKPLGLADSPRLRLGTAQADLPAVERSGPPVRRETGIELQPLLGGARPHDLTDPQT